MKVGTDTSKFPGVQEKGAIWTLQAIAEMGLDGAFFRSPFDLSSELDSAELSDVAQAAKDLGLYLEVGLCKVNPFALPESPEIRAFGDGDVIAGMRRMIEALASVGISELWTATANYQFRLKGLRVCDRFRTDVSWSDQLDATARVLRKLAPVLEHVGSRLSLETHEEISTFEVVRLIEAAESDVFGVTLDTANVFVRGEDPIAATRRVAPYVRLTHIRDVALLPTPDGIGRFVVPVGRGVIDWTELLSILSAHNPDLHLSIEGIKGSSAEMSVFIDDPEWRASNADLTDEELARVISLTDDYERSVALGARPGLDVLRQSSGDAASLDFIVESARELRRLCAHIGRGRTGDSSRVHIHPHNGIAQPN